MEKLDIVADLLARIDRAWASIVLNLVLQYGLLFYDK